MTSQSVGLQPVRAPSDGSSEQPFRLLSFSIIHHSLENRFLANAKIPPASDWLARARRENDLLKFKESHAMCGWRGRGGGVMRHLRNHRQQPMHRDVHRIARRHL